MVKCYNRILEALLSKFVDLNQRDIDIHILYLLMAYCFSVHNTTGCSSSKMMLRREQQLLTDLMFKRSEEVLPATDYTY